MRKASFIFLAIILCCLTAQAQRPSFRAGARYGRFSNIDDAAALLLKTNGYPSFDLAVGWTANPADSNYIADAWRYPIFGIGASVNANQCMKFRDGIRFSNFYNLYGFMEWDFLKTERLSAGLYGELGLGYFRNIYDKTGNPYQIFVGSPLSIFVGFGPYVKWRPSPHWEMGISPMFWHHSNGRISVPNLGLNELGAELFARYYMDPPYTGERRFKGRYHYDKKFNWDIFASGTRYISRAQWLAEADNTTYRLRAGIGATAMWRITDVFSTGAEIELDYSSDAKDLERYDQIINGTTSDKGYHPFYTGIASANELYFGKHFSMVACVGLYVFREMGIEENVSRLYQKLGARYYFERLGNTFLGFNVRAFNFGRADNMDFYIGKRF